MSKFKELDILLDEITTSAKAIITSTNNLISLLKKDSEEPNQNDDGYSYEESEVYVKKEITLEEVRKVLADISRSGKTLQVKELLKKYGANKLSEVDKNNYEDLLKDAGELNGK